MIILFLDWEQHKVSAVIQVCEGANEELVTRQLLLPRMLNA